MHVADQPQVHRRIGQPGDAEFQRPHVVEHLLHVVERGAARAARHARGGELLPGLVGVQVGDARLRALDAAGEHGLLAQERPQQQVRIRQPAAQRGQLAQRIGRVRGHPEQLAVGDQARRQRIGHEGGVTDALGLGRHEAAGGRIGGEGVHRFSHR